MGGIDLSTDDDDRRLAGRLAGLGCVSHQVREDLPEEYIITIDCSELAGGRDGCAGWQLVLDVVGCSARHALEVHRSD